MSGESKDETKPMIQCPYCPEMMIESSLKGHMVDEHWDILFRNAPAAVTTPPSGGMPEVLGTVMGRTPAEIGDLKDRVNTLELAVNKLIEIASSGRSPEGAETPGAEAAPGVEQGGSALGLISRLMAPEDPFKQLAYDAMRQSMVTNQALTYGLMKAMGLKIGKKALARFEKGLEGEGEGESTYHETTSEE